MYKIVLPLFEYNLGGYWFRWWPCEISGCVYSHNQGLGIRIHVLFIFSSWRTNHILGGNGINQSLDSSPALLNTDPLDTVLINKRRAQSIFIAAQSFLFYWQWPMSECEWVLFGLRNFGKIPGAKTFYWKLNLTKIFIIYIS